MGLLPVCLTSRWYCHLDDDEYVNIEVLVKLLSRYNPERERIYLGHTPPKASRGQKVRSISMQWSYYGVCC